MTINYQAILAQVEGLFQGLFITNLPLLETTAKGYLTKTEARLSTLASNALSGSLTKDDITFALGAEPGILMSELDSFAEAGLSIAQDAINQVQNLAVDIFKQAAIAVIPTVTTDTVSQGPGTIPPTQGPQ